MIETIFYVLKTYYSLLFSFRRGEVVAEGGAVELGLGGRLGEGGRGRGVGVGGRAVLRLRDGRGLFEGLRLLEGLAHRVQEAELGGGRVAGVG